MVQKKPMNFARDRERKPNPLAESGNDFDDGIDQRVKRAQTNDAIDTRFRFERYKDPFSRTGWLINMHPAEKLDENRRMVSMVDYYFMEENGSRFKASLPYRPYFYILARLGTEREVQTYLLKKYAGLIVNIEQVLKEDLDLPNHLTGLKQRYLKLAFNNTTDLVKVRRELMPRIRKNRERDASKSDYSDMLTSHLANSVHLSNDAENMISNADQMDNLIDIREYDVPFHVRVAIDLKMFVGLWYSVIGHGDSSADISLLDRDDRPDPIVLAFDIETTKLPLKFPDSATDQIMMISYMIDGQGFLIVNREICSADVEDFEYTPKPEYEGPFTVFNVPDECSVVQRFFNHIQEVCPHIIVTYNGDSFDWPFVEARAAVHGFNMFKEIGFQKDSQGEYKSRQCIHMDAFRWVKRDSYLPVGSQNLKACTRAKLRYDPIELDPEDMCRMAAEQPQTLANYSVSDAVATYYLYMKYVHPFVFALCNIIPMEPDEVLRKGSGTLCEALLMVEAFHANVIFPNKQETVFNKLTDDGHLLDTETYVGGHVESIESGVFRANLPCRFRLVPSAFQDLIDSVERTMQFTIEEEHTVKITDVENFNEICEQIKEQLSSLRDIPSRLESPIIYHLDVGAMYPNIILTNRLQPPAIVNDAICAACDFNKPDARCQRVMKWMWRGEVMPVKRGEIQRTVQQLEMETFPSEFPGGPPRHFHQMSKEEQATWQKKRLQDYCRKAYKRLHDTRLEERHTTVCQRENSFYVDTVRKFRDRRYEYKAKLKDAKAAITKAYESGDASEIKLAKSKEILWDSLQLAHKCILNSFYGYVMRKGSRWFSMEMAGIVCYTGANIITQARELVEQIGRPLELDTDGIWCVLPASFPENFVFKTKNSKKPKVTVSYPGAMLNIMVKDAFTNDQYHDLVNPEKLEYRVRSENSIFFEVDGPYLAMVLPASKEEGKRLKKRYAVFNFDGSLAELKGFEVKRRGELELIKIFQSSVFDAFLQGSTIEECYASAAKVADYWLDVLTSQAADMPDSELFDLISERRNMSRKLADYGSQKSTSISTAKRLAEFLGDQMVKDAGLNCRFIIAKKPDGAPVTERAIPLEIFFSEPTIQHHYLRKWLKEPSMTEFDIRSILDWDYYMERFGNCIAKIITIPAAMQGVSNPVPRVRHPDWLHKKLLEKNDTLRQKKINEIFQKVDKVQDIENSVNRPNSLGFAPAIVCAKKRNRSGVPVRNSQPIPDMIHRHWREALGQPPKMGRTRESQLKWLAFQKEKWKHLDLQRKERRRNERRQNQTSTELRSIIQRPQNAMTSFIRKTALAMLELPWNILQVVETSTPGLFRLWALIGSDLHEIRLEVPRVFYINQKVAKPAESSNTYKRLYKALPRSHERLFLYRYSVPETEFLKHVDDLNHELSLPECEGVYETQVPMLFRVFLELGCICQVAVDKRKKLAAKESDYFHLDDLEFRSLAQFDYLEAGSIRHLYIYYYSQDSRALIGLFYPSAKRGIVCVVERSKTNQMPNLVTLFNTERNHKLEKGTPVDNLPKENQQFEIVVEATLTTAAKAINKQLQQYRDEKRGPMILSYQSSTNIEELFQLCPAVTHLPLVRIHGPKDENVFSVLEWQRVGSRRMMQHYMNVETYLQSYANLCRYLHIPLGNVPTNHAVLGTDLFFARHLAKANHILWCSQTPRPDLGGKEVDDNRLLMSMEEMGEVEINNPGFYTSVCLLLDIAALPVTAVLQANLIHEIEGGSSAVGFDTAPTMAIDQLVEGNLAQKQLASYDETAASASAFRILRTMIQGWFKDVLKFSNPFADEQMIYFYRWLRSPDSLLYDPALKKTVFMLMQKLLMQLVAELKRLGAVIVHADLSQIIICTKKETMEDAEGYLDYVLNSIKQKDLFAPLDISIQTAYDVLLYLDQANFGGIKSSKLRDSPDGDIIEDNQDRIVDMQWNMANFLPTAANVRKQFEDIIAQYIGEVHHFVMRKSSNPDVKVKKRMEQSSQQMAPIGGSGNEPGKSDDLIEFCQLYVEEKLIQEFLDTVHQTQKSVGTIHEVREHGSTILFPKVPGSHLKMQNPTLELIKSVCKVLSLDSAISEEIYSLRRNALRLIGFGEFSPMAEWKDPCLSFRLPEVICGNCNFCRYLDLCRDPSVCNGESIDWRCSQCSHPYDKSDIECRLLEVVNRLIMSYNLQDLQCQKCRGIKVDHMSYRCQCAGDYIETFAKEDLSWKMKTFFSIATYYKLDLLHETLRTLISLNPSLKQMCDEWLL